LHYLKDLEKPQPEDALVLPPETVEVEQPKQVESFDLAPSEGEQLNLFESD